MLRNRIKDNLFGKSINELGAAIFASYEEIHEIANKEDLSDVPLGKMIEIADALGAGIVDLYEEIYYKVYMSIDTGNDELSVADKEMFKSYNYENCERFIIDDYNPNKYEDILDSCSKFDIKYSIVGFVRNDVDIWEVDEKTDVVEYTADAKHVVGLQRKIEGYRELIDRVNSMGEHAEEVYQDPLDFDYDMFLRITEDVGYEHIDLIELNDAEKYREESFKMVDDFYRNLEKLKNTYAVDKVIIK